MRRVFGRRLRSGDLRASIAGFWLWWSGSGAHDVAAALDAGEPERVEPELSARVERIHPGLAWELSKGTTARHQLVVTAAGDPHLRATARRWLHASPVENQTWEFRDTRQPADIDGMVLTLADAAVSFDEALVGAHVQQAQVDVTLFHPAMSDLDDDTRMEVAFLLLDSTLGEAAVETWLGVIEPVTQIPSHPMSLRTLRSVVAETERETTQGDGVYSMLQATTRHGPLLAMVRQPMRPMIAPQLDTHVQVTVPYHARNGSGLPTAETLGELRALEDHLLRLVGDGARLVVHETCNGERRMHIYVDGATPAAAQIEAGVRGWENGKVKVRSKHDPAWEQISRFRHAVPRDDDGTGQDQPAD